MSIDVVLKKMWLGGKPNRLRRLTDFVQELIMEGLAPVAGVGDMKSAETLGQRLKRLRQAANFTQERLGAETGLAVSNIRNWEQGHRTLNVFGLFKIARALGRKMEEFLDGLAETGLRRKPKTRRAKATGISS